MISLELKTLDMVCEECRISHKDLLKLIFREWVIPADPERHCFDDEDIARIRLIKTLLEELEVGESAIPIILNLLDQLYVLRKIMSDNHFGPTEASE
jgi:chaperone modulatory protein CbpM